MLLCNIICAFFTHALTIFTLTNFQCPGIFVLLSTDLYRYRIRFYTTYYYNKVVKLLYSNKFIRKARPKTHKVRLHLLLNKIFHTTVLLFPLNFFLIHASLKFSFECFRGYYKSSMGGVRVREETDEQLKLVKEPSLQSFGIVIGLYSSKMAFFSL